MCARCNQAKKGDGSKLTAVCHDCKADTLEINEWYMLNDNVWKQTGMKNGYLCIGCVEKRLRRKLVWADFMSLAPVNFMAEFSRSRRLTNRLSK